MDISETPGMVRLKFGMWGTDRGQQKFLIFIEAA